MNAISFAGTRRMTGGARAIDPHDAAAQLDALVRESASTGAARQVLLLRLSRLPRDLSQPHHLRLAQEALDPLAVADRARLFVLPNADAVMVWRGAAPGLLASSLERLRHLFDDESSSAPSPDHLAEHLLLPDAADTLLAAIAGSRQPAPLPQASPTARLPLDPAMLAGLEQALASADLARFARRRPVCAHVPGEGFRLAWEKRVFSLAEISDTLAPERDLKAAPWLFRRLTRTLDHRMMALLGAADELRDAGPFSLGLNIASLLSPAFLRFDGTLPGRLRGHVVIELRPEDVLADPAAFLFAADFARTRQYRLLLRGLTAADFAVFPPASLRVDHVRLDWSSALSAIELPEQIPRQVVLNGVGDSAALEWGQRQGIALFQGSLVQPHRRPRI